MEKKPFAYVYTCYDPNIRDALIAYCEEHYGNKHYIFDPDPGAVKTLVSPNDVANPRIVLAKMKLAHEKVHSPVDVIVLINHTSCGAYADSGVTFTDPAAEQEFHAHELATAERLVQDNFPDIRIETHFFSKEEQKMVW